MDPTIGGSHGRVRLITHPKEQVHPTNTAALALAVAAEHGLDLQQWVWQRTERDIHVERIQAHHAVLLYPSHDASVVTASLDPQCGDLSAYRDCQFLLIDATWQQAQKMYNQSPYLHTVPKLQLQIAHPSTFVRRRNQRNGAWCTAEVIAWLWYGLGYETAAQHLVAEFNAFNQR